MHNLTALSQYIVPISLFKVVYMKNVFRFTSFQTQSLCITCRIRWLYAEILLAENNNKSFEYPNPCNDKAEEEQAPSEPEWPSLIGSLSTKEGSEEKSGQLSNSNLNV